jgi:hypothetical protein
LIADCFLSDYDLRLYAISRAKTLQKPKLKWVGVARSPYHGGPPSRPPFFLLPRQTGGSITTTTCTERDNQKVAEYLRHQAALCELSNPDDSSGFAKAPAESVSEVPPADDKYTKWLSPTDSGTVIELDEETDSEDNMSGFSSSF